MYHEYNKYIYIMMYDIILVSVKVCQGAKIPSGPTKSLIINVVNKQVLK